MPKKTKKQSFIAPASLPKRFLAFMIDLLIIDFLLLSPFSRIIENLLPVNNLISLYSTFHSPKIRFALALISIITGFFILLYFTIFEYLTSQTPGKMLLKIYIIPEGTKKLKFWNYLLNNLSFLPVSIFIILLIIDVIYIFKSPKKQRLLEKLNHLITIEEIKKTN